MSCLLCDLCCRRSSWLPSAHGGAGGGGGGSDRSSASPRPAPVGTPWPPRPGTSPWWPVDVFCSPST
eukprot:9268927-Lingulodinium_polyedra.AAC.1